jgi:hypothetical protein
MITMRGFRAMTHPHTNRKLAKAVLAASALSAALSPVLASAALAQEAPPIRQTTTQTTTTRTVTTTSVEQDPVYGYAGSGAGDYRNPPPEPAAPANYDGSQLPPPPVDYIPPANPEEQRLSDTQYAQSAQDWAAQNCIKSKPKVGNGALIGGILGAIIGSGLGGRHDHGTGMAVGALVGAAGGAAVASASGGDTSPGCPPGYSVRPQAVTYTYSPDYYYAAPGWYQPWVYVDGYWSYRPYPYHDWYYRTYRGPVRGPAYGGPRYGGYRGPMHDGPHGYRR